MATSVQMDANSFNSIPLEDLIDDVLGDDFIGRCWGSELSGRICTPDFSPGTNHLKNKFCEICRRDGFAVLAERVRSVERKEAFPNTNGRSVWTRGSRLCNQTMKCVGPAVVIFEDHNAAEISTASAPVPDHWLRRDASGALYVHFNIKLGTVCPAPTSAADAFKRARDDDSSQDERRLVCPPRTALTVSRGDALDGGWRGDVHASEEDHAALCAALCHTQIQEELQGRLSLCAATLGSLSSADRSVMHRMFRQAMERQLSLSVGEACLSRVMRAVVQSNGDLSPGRVAKGGAYASTGSVADIQLHLFCNLLCDEAVWTEFVKHLSEHRRIGLVDKTSFAPHQELSQVTESLRLLSFSKSAQAAAAVQVIAATGACTPAALGEERWRSAVRHTAELIERMLQAVDTPWEEDVSFARTCVSDGVLYCHTDAELTGTDETLDEISGRANELIDRSFVLFGFLPVTGREGLFRISKTPASGGVMDGMFPWEKLYAGTHILEVLREEKPDGVRCAYIDWDLERDRPLSFNEEKQLVNLSVCSLHFDVCSRTWRVACMDSYVLPSWLHSLRGGPMSGPIDLGMLTLFNWFMRSWAASASIECFNRALEDSRALSRMIQ